MKIYILCKNANARQAIKAFTELDRATAHMQELVKKEFESNSVNLTMIGQYGYPYGSLWTGAPATQLQQPTFTYAPMAVSNAYFIEELELESTIEGLEL